MVKVYSTMLPSLSVTVRLVVSTFSVSRAFVPRAALGRGHFPSYFLTLPGATGGLNALVSLIRQARSAAYRSESRSLSGTCT